MGKLGFRGDTSKKIFALKEPSSGEVHLVNETDDVTLLKATPTTITDAGGVELASHGSRHNYGGADAIPDDGLRYRQVKVVFGSESSVTVSAGGTYTIGEGVYYILCGANTKVQVYINGAWHDLTGVGALALVFSDGSNVRLYNTGTADESSVLKPIS